MKRLSGAGALFVRGTRGRGGGVRLSGSFLSPSGFWWFPGVPWAEPSRKAEVRWTSWLPSWKSGHSAPVPEAHVQLKCGKSVSGGTIDKRSDPLLEKLLNAPTPTLALGSPGGRAHPERWPVAMATAGAATTQVRKRALRRGSRFRAAAGIRERRRVTRRDRSWGRRPLFGAFPGSNRAGSWRAAASRLPVPGPITGRAVGGGAARSLPGGSGAGPSAVFGRSQDTCEHPGPGLGRRGLGKREEACRPAAQGEGS